MKSNEFKTLVEDKFEVHCRTTLMSARTKSEQDSDILISGMDYPLGIRFISCKTIKKLDKKFIERSKTIKELVETIKVYEQIFK